MIGTYPLRLCVRHDVASTAPTCWLCGARCTKTVTPSGSGGVFNPPPAAQPYDRTTTRRSAA